MPALAPRTKTTIARPLKVLVPLIQQEWEAGERAGVEHWLRTGELLLEARGQQPYGHFGAWLTKHFTFTPRMAYRYMAMAERVRTEPEVVTRGSQPSGRELSGRKPDHHAWKPAFKAAAELDAELFAQERQTEDEEIRIRRELVSELFDLGYRALATRLHPDRGGSKDAMVRLNDLRTQLTQLAKTRRWL